MINVEPFNAKLVADPEMRETKRGTVCNMRVRQIDPGKPSVFLDVAAFDTELVEKCKALVKGAIVTFGGGIIYQEWETKPNGRGKPQKRSKHALLAESVSVAPAE